MRRRRLRRDRGAAPPRGSARRRRRSRRRGARRPPRGPGRAPRGGRAGLPYRAGRRPAATRARRGRRRSGRRGRVAAAVSCDPPCPWSPEAATTPPRRRPRGSCSAVGSPAGRALSPGCVPFLGPRASRRGGRLDPRREPDRRRGAYPPPPRPRRPRRSSRPLGAPGWRPPRRRARCCSPGS